MRASPFGFTNFSRGINVIDSPYTLQEGEARDVLNMVSSPRGAIKKRYGSTTFASAGASSFPELGAATDKLDRAEDPLNNAGKWTQNGLAGTLDKGTDTATGWHAKAQGFPTISVVDNWQRSEDPLSNGGKWVEWGTTGKAKCAANGVGLVTKTLGQTVTGESAYWKDIKQVSPAVSATLAEEPAGTGGANTFFELIVSAGTAATDLRYTVMLTKTATEKWKAQIWVYEGGSGEGTELGTITFKTADRLGITVKGGLITAWRYNSGITTWETLGTTTDFKHTTRITEGYCGFRMNTEALPLMYWKDFSIGEYPTRSSAYWNVTKQVNPAVQAEVAVIPTSPGSTTNVIDFFALTIINDGATGKGYYGVVRRKTNSIEALLYTESGQLATAVISRKMEAGELWGLSLRNERLVIWYKPVAGVWTRACEAATSTYTEGFAGIDTTIVSSDAFRLKNFDFGEMTAPTLPENIGLTLAQVTVASGTYLIVQGEKKLFSINPAGEVSEIKTGLTEGKRWSVVQAAEGTRVVQGPVYLSNGTDAPLYWAGTAKGTEAKTWTAKAEGEFVEVPKAQYLVYLANRIWASGVSTDSSSVRFSGFAAVVGEGEKADPTNWPKENVVWFEKDDGQAITGMGIAGAYLMVFKRHKTWAVYDLNEGENRRVSDSVGCVSHRSIVETPQGTFFLTPDQGIFVTNGTNVREVSRNVRPILQGIDTNEARAADPTQLEFASGAFLNGHYYLSYIAKDGTQKTLDYDTVLQSWWIHDLAGNQWVAWEPVVGAASLYTVPNKLKAGVVKAFVKDVYTDSGSNYTGARSQTCFWISNWEPFFVYILRHRLNQPQLKKRIRQLFVDGRGELLTTVYKKFSSSGEILKGVVDNADMASPGSPLTLGSASFETQAARYYSVGISRLWSFGFGNNSAEPLEIDSYACDLSFRKS